jgi:hypothetical protein
VNASGRVRAVPKRRSESAKPLQSSTSWNNDCFMPRIRDLADQQLHRIDRDVVYPNLAGLFRSRVDGDLIPEQWDQLVRVAASLN